MFLYHYCSLEAFISIIQNKEVWLSDITRMNDHLEGKWIDRIADRIAQTEFGLREGVFSKYLEEDRDKRRVFGFCLSSKDDTLSQWRAYANDGTGVAIGFNPGYFQWWAENSNLGRAELLEVLYDEQDQETVLKADTAFTDIKEAIADNAEADLSDWLELGREVGAGIRKEVNIEEMTKKAEAARNKLRKAIQHGWWRYRYAFKNPAFSEEGEYRLIAPIPNLLKYKNDFATGATLSYLTNTKMRPSGNSLISYIPIPLNESDDGNAKRSYVTEIVLGPKNETDLDELKFFLYVNGFRDCEVRKSAASYR